MSHVLRRCVFSAALFATTLAVHVRAQTLPDATMARDTNQPIDTAYTAKMQQYTTAPEFTSPLVNYLPESSTVPTPAKVLGDVAGAPDMLPYAEDVYRYFRMLAAASPRVRVVTIGKSEEGREMIAVAIADEKLLAAQKENDARLAQLADPRTLGLDDAKARPLIDASFPVYYITGTIHSTETGAPTALMELAYRLAVDDSPYIQHIRSHMITLITPVVEVDGRNRMVDLYRWHKAHPGENYARLMYWGHYVAHDNNRDAMAMTLQLTRNVLDTYLGWHAQVLHDLHESVPLLYDNTVGDGPYNAWIDPILADEWAELGWNNTAQMQTLNMPGVFTHGDFDTWSPGYLMFLAGMHNGISRLYETFGNGGADTEKRTLTPEEYGRTWYRQNPPPPVLTWSQRDNNNYEESALLSTLFYFSQHTHHFLENYYTKSKRTVEKPQREGPAAYVFPASTAEANRQAQLLRILRLQHVELQQLTEAQTITVPPAHHADPTKDDKPTSVMLPAGSVVVRMDQPFARAADALLDRQYWAPDDPQKHPYDDTGWSFPELFNVKAVRVTDAKFLDAKMAPLADPAVLITAPAGSGGTYAIANTGQTNLLAFAYKLKGKNVRVTEQPTDVAGTHLPAGSLLVSGVADSAVTDALKQTMLTATRLPEASSVPMHALTLPRVAVMHTWLSTQREGWWRLGLDNAGIPYDYISTQTAAATPDLRSKYDVIVFAPLGGASAQQILAGTPRYGNATPWKKTALTPNLGLTDQTDDTRPGLGYDGLQHLQQFVTNGGLLITAEDTAQFAIDTGLAPGVSVASHGDTRVTGSVLQTVFVLPQSPIATGYGANLPVLSDDGMAFNVSSTVGGRGGRSLMDPYQSRPTGRGSVGDDDTVQGRTAVAPYIPPQTKAWEPRPLNDEQTRNNPNVIPEMQRPEVILRFVDSKDLLRSGLLDKGGSIAEHAVVVLAHLGRGAVLLCGNNPIYRGETIGSYPLVLNAMMHFDHLQHLPPVPPKPDSKALPAPAPGVPSSQPSGPATPVGKP